MATYATRTCVECGIRKPQPQMYQRETYSEVAKSKPGISGATMAGVFLGDKKSGNAFNRWLFNSNQRTYKRKRKIWLCGDCAGVNNKKSQSSGNKKGSAYGTFLKWIFIFILIGAVIDLFDGVNNDSVNNTSSTQQSN